MTVFIMYCKICNRLGLNRSEFGRLFRLSLTSVETELQCLIVPLL